MTLYVVTINVASAKAQGGPLPGFSGDLPPDLPFVREWRRFVHEMAGALGHRNAAHARLPRSFTGGRRRGRQPCARPPIVA